MQTHFDVSTVRIVVQGHILICKIQGLRFIQKSLQGRATRQDLAVLFPSYRVKPRKPAIKIIGYEIPILDLLLTFRAPILLECNRYFKRYFGTMSAS
jgi:hypothetical protein